LPDFACILDSVPGLLFSYIYRNSFSLQYPRTSEEHVSLSSHQAPGSVLQSTGLLVDTNLDTSVPDAYRPPPAPIPFDAAVGRPQTPGRLREVRGDKNHGALQTTTSASGQENTALNTRETLAKCEDAKDLDCKVQINSEPGSAKELEIELSKLVEPLVSATEEEDEEEEEDCPICLEGIMPLLNSFFNRMFVAYGSEIASTIWLF